MDGMDGEQQFSLSWNNFHGNVSRELSTLLGSGALADVTLAVGGELLQAHRLVLAICSPYFKRMFQANPHHHPIVVLRDVTHKAMLDLLQFMYHGEVSVKREDLTGFIATAELLQIKGLTNKETEDEDREQELPKQATPEPSSVNAPQQRVSHTTDSICPDEHISYTVEMKRKILNEKIQRLNQMKRTSEQFLQSNYSYHTERPEKRPRSREKQLINNHSQNARYEKLYEDVPTDMSNYSDSHKSNTSQDYEDGGKTDVAYDVSVLDLKTECDDDIVVTDPAIHDSAKTFDCASERTPSKETLHPPQDDAGGLSSIFMDLKSIVNGKFSYRASQYAQNVLRGKQHSLTTIPQKEDGKKKYPQRSCRSCWRMGKRRDTRFMCTYCAVPFCKSPCFEVHLSKVAAKIGPSEDEFNFI